MNLPLLKWLYWVLWLILFSNDDVVSKAIWVGFIRMNINVIERKMSHLPSWQNDSSGCCHENSTTNTGHDLDLKRKVVG